MKKKIFVIETEHGFIKSFSRNLEKEKLSEDYEIIQITPDNYDSLDTIVDSIIGKILEDYKIFKNCYAIFVDINIIEDKKEEDQIDDTYGIDISVKLRDIFPLTPIFIITNKTENTRDFDGLSLSSLEDVDGVFVKSFIVGQHFDRERFKLIFEKAETKRAKTYQNISSTSMFTTDALSVDFCIITATREPEFEEIQRNVHQNWSIIPDSELIIKSNTNYFKGYIEINEKRYSVVVATDNKMGMTAANSLATRMIVNFKPKFLVMLGMAAGIDDKKTKIGDIIVAERIWNYDNVKVEIVKDENSSTLEKRVYSPLKDDIVLDEGIRRQLEKFMLAKDKESILAKIRSEYIGKYAIKHVLDVLPGSFASGGALVADEKFVFERIKPQDRKIIGFDMDGYGCAQAIVPFNQIDTKFILIKGVSDFGSGDKDSLDKESNQRYACYTSFQFFLNFIPYLMDSI